MRITHPQMAYQGIAPENVFFVANDQRVQMGTGYIYPFFQGEMYPERPAHLFMEIDAQPSARALMYGALLARAEQLRAQSPNVPTRLYAQVAPANLELLRFYESCGFRNDDGEDVYRFPVPEGMARAPMGMQFTAAFADEAGLQAFLSRINAYRIQPITRDYLTLWQQQPHFLAVGLYRAGAPVCEAMFTGTGMDATLLMIYTKAEYRRQGMAKQLLGIAAQYLREQGVTNIYTHIFRRSVAQMGLMRSLNAVYLNTVTALPGIDL